MAGIEHIASLDDAAYFSLVDKAFAQKPNWSVTNYCREFLTKRAETGLISQKSVHEKHPAPSPAAV